MFVFSHHRWAMSTHGFLRKRLDGGGTGRYGVANDRMVRLKEGEWMEMKREWITYEDEEAWLDARVLDVTSTEVSALFGMCPYMTLYDLWHRKRDEYRVTITQTERMTWGKRLEKAIATGVAEEQEWNIRAFNQYGRIPSLRVGASFDYRILGDPKAVLEIKCVDSWIAKNQWDFKEGIVPPHIDMQVQHQMLVSGLDRAFIAVLVGGNALHLVDVKKNMEVHSSIVTEVTKFWQTIEQNQAPKPDFERDAKFIVSQNQYAEPNKVVEEGDNPILTALCASYKEAGAAETAAAKRKAGVKAELLTLIGDAEKVKLNGFTISAGMRAEVPVSYIRKATRDFRITPKKGKE